MMEVFLYNSTVCRLCGEENDNGTLLYSPEENNQNLCEIINAYLPIKVSDDGQLPRTICPGCTIQLEATVEFLNLIINGQKVIRRLYQREREYKKSISKNNEESVSIAENIIYEINTSDGVYQVEHPVSLQVAGLEKPKRKRGRPPKKSKTQEEVVEQAANKNLPEPKNVKNDKQEEEEPSGKRRRKTPSRFKEAVQGKELERILLEEGVIDEEERSKSLPPPKVPEIPKEPEVIGHLEESGEPVVVVKGKGRGRPKGHTRQTHETCPICGMEFTSVGRYMSHIAQHGSVRYRCNCGVAFTTRLSFSDHQNDSGHTGRTIEPCSPSDEEQQKAHSQATQSSQSQIKEKTVTQQSNLIQSCDDKSTTGAMESITHSEKLPDLCSSLTETDNQIVSEVVELQDETVDIENYVGKSTDASKDENSEAVTEPNEENESEGKLKLKCHFCNKMYSSKQSRALHTKAVHMGDRSHACDQCGARFGYPRSLALHRISHRRARPTGYACDLCGKVLNHPSSVVYHKQTEHASQRFVCGTCGKCFRHKQLLLRHQLVHSEARPYSCKMCNATFKTKANLLNHQLLHSGVKKFSCEICKARFAHKTSLTLHMRWHTGVKPYVCGICDKSFSQKGNLSEHQRIHTGEKPYSCELCPRRFTTSSQHRLHLRRHPQRIKMEDTQEEVVIESPQKQQGATNKVKKQMSLLVSDKQQESEPASEEEQVIYVAYEAADSQLPAFHIINAKEKIEMEEEQSGELYSGTSLLVPSQLQTLQLEPESIIGSENLNLETEQLELESDVHGHMKVESDHNIILEDGQLELDNVQLELETGDYVLDQDLEEKDNGEPHIDMRSGGGRGLQLTMQDGTRLALASVGGGALQVITPDGQTIPVEINDYNQEELSSHSGNVLQQFNVMKSEDDGSVTYFTISNLPTMWKK